MAGGAAHAAAFSPLVTRLTGVVPAGAGAALSAVVSTGTLLAAVLGVTLLGGLHLTLTATGRHGPVLALPPALLTAVLLLAGAFAARRATRPVRDGWRAPASPEVAGSRP